MRVTAARPCLAILLVASAIACDSTVEVPWNAPDTVTPGSRLRPWMAVAGDAAGFLGWHDTELGVGCSFTNAADGVKRCMPLRWSVVFVDSMCSQPALLTYCGYEVDYGALRDATLLQEQCAAFDPYDPPSFMYRRSDAPLQADAYYRGRIENGEVVCDPVPQALEPHESLVSAVPMSLENFVAGQELIEPGEGRLGTRVMVASDGARHIIGPYDTAFARQCRSTPDWADGRECVSFSSQWPGFADASCSQPAVVTRCAPPVVVSERVDQCTIRLSSVGPPVDHYYNYSEGSCESDEPLPDGYQAYQVGPELALGQLPAIKMRNVGSGRLQARFQSDAFGNPVGVARLYDTDLEVYCTPVELPQVGVVCVYNWGFRVKPELERFADPGCSEPVYVHAGCDHWLPRWVEHEVFQGGCGTSATLPKVRPVLGPLEIVYKHSGSKCQEAQLEEGQRAFELGAPLPLDAFAKASVELW